jgi:hypothetical protein
VAANPPQSPWRTAERFLKSSFPSAPRDVIQDAHSTRRTPGGSALLEGAEESSRGFDVCRVEALDESVEDGLEVQQGIGRAPLIAQHVSKACRGPQR